jgi:hypothetical protein
MTSGIQAGGRLARIPKNAPPDDLTQWGTGAEQGSQVLDISRVSPTGLHLGLGKDLTLSRRAVREQRARNGRRGKSVCHT